jgi:hypothetical protein
VIAALRFNDLLIEFLLRARPWLMAEGDEDVPLDDPRRSPDWCHAHGCPLSQCSGQHG